MKKNLSYQTMKNFFLNFIQIKIINFYSNNEYFN